MIEKIGSLFEPDVLLDTQYWGTFIRRTDLEPEKMLMLAVLQDAITCFQEHVLEPNPQFYEEVGWILEENSNWLFSFKNICEALDLDPNYIRDGLLRLKETRLAEAARIHPPHLGGKQRSSASIQA
ncbi:MAG: hypothetical protein ACREQA_09935 [Candidatus Binatia bacterium]